MSDLNLQANIAVDTANDALAENELKKTDPSIPSVAKIMINRRFYYEHK